MKLFFLGRSSRSPKLCVQFLKNNTDRSVCASIPSVLVNNSKHRLKPGLWRSSFNNNNYLNPTYRSSSALGNIFTKYIGCNFNFCYDYFFNNSYLKPLLSPTMGVHTVLMSSDVSDEGNRFAAVNMALEMDQAGIESSPLKNVLKSDYNQETEYAESVVTVDTSDADDRDISKNGTSVSDSTSDSHSTSSKAESSSPSEPATITTTTISIDDSPYPITAQTETNIVSRKPVVPLEAVVVSPSSNQVTIATSPAKVSLPPLLSFPQHKSNNNRGLRKSLVNGWTYFKRIQTVPRDCRALSRYIRLLYRMRLAKRANLNVPTAFDQTTAKHPNKVAFFFEDQTWTFAQVQAYSYRVAQVFRGKVLKGDGVALLMENRVEYIAIWLGLARLGAVPALLNNNLRLSSLSHCITSADCKMIVCGAELQHALSEIKESMSSLPVYVSGAGKKDDSAITIPGAENLDTLQSGAPATPVPEQRDVNFSDKLLYIYTSGTTGLPKAAVITHSRFIFAGVGMLCIIGITPDDTLYEPLPLYHTAGGNIGVGMTVCDGVTIALRKKFSVSNYFPDCDKYGCTVAQYIGEICRYLLNSPATPADKQHKIRVMFGNGLRPQIWEQFQERFNIPRISEFYGSTEGNANIINMDGRVGAVGFLSVLLPSIYPCALIKVNTDTGIPVRDRNGICIRCRPGEPGEFVGKIVPNDPLREFKGYADKKATTKKIIKDVFKKGDSAFLSGDLLVMDEEGYLFFKDRTGDTFRWKGENVSTAEVENHLSALVKSTDVSVYGVEIPNTEGRAGMAAVVDPEGSLDVNEVARGVITLLPSYARPVFFRTVKHMEMTGTYKLRKTDLQKEGFDVRVIKDPVYVLDAKTQCYNLMGTDVYEKIMDGQMRV